MGVSTKREYFLPKSQINYFLYLQMTLAHVSSPSQGQIIDKLPWNVATLWRVVLGARFETWTVIRASSFPATPARGRRKPPNCACSTWPRSPRTPGSATRSSTKSSNRTPCSRHSATPKPTATTTHPDSWVFLTISHFDFIKCKSLYCLDLKWLYYGAMRELSYCIQYMYCTLLYIVYRKWKSS